VVGALLLHEAQDHGPLHAQHGVEELVHGGLGLALVVERVVQGIQVHGVLSLWGAGTVGLGPLYAQQADRVPGFADG
jgi:hypothetical protein